MTYTGYNIPNFCSITSTINQQMHLYNFRLKHLKPLRHVSIFSDHHQQIPTQHDMLPQHLVYKNELNREYVITLARNDETP